MSFRSRLTLVAAVAVAVSIAVASLVVYFVVRGELRGQIDSGLRASAQTIASFPLSSEPSPGGQEVLRLPESLIGVGGFAQAVNSEGRTARPRFQHQKLPIDRRALAVADGRHDPYFRVATVDGVRLRMLTVPYEIQQGVAIQVARPLHELDQTLERTRTLLLAVTLGGVLIAALLGLLVARAALSPVRRLTETTEHVTETGDLTSRIETHERRDELSRLAGSFNTMLEALERSVNAQRQLVADASHELRTPLTSLRTNIEVLARGEELAPEAREHLLADVVEQLAEMSSLVAELVELAPGEAPPAEAEDVRLDLLVGDVVERARRNTPGVEFVATLEPSVVHGVPRTLDRAIGNLLDNAAKWSPAGGTVEVGVREGQVSVRDHGPGIDGSDLPHVFDRFYRAASARGLPGSGLGLSIVRQVAEAHGGEVLVERAEGGGTRMRLRLAPRSQRASERRGSDPGRSL